MRQHRLEGNAGAITALAPMQDQQLATASSGGSIIVWSLPTGDQLAQAHCTAGVCSLVSVGGGRLASGSVDTSITLWKVPLAASRSLGRYLEPVATLAGHAGPVHALAFLDVHGWLASGATDGSVRLWRADERWLDDPCNAGLAHSTVQTELEPESEPKLVLRWHEALENGEL